MPTGTNILNAIISGLGIGGLFAVTALGLSLAFGVMRLINIAHGEFMVLGGYVAFFLGQVAGLDPLVSALVAVVAAAVVAYPLQHFLLTPVMSRGAGAPLLITFGISVVLQNLFIRFFYPEVRSLSAGYAQANFTVGSITVPIIYLISLGIGVVVLGIAHVAITRTTFGRSLRASAEDAAAAAVVGVNVRRVHALTFAVAAAAAAIGGILVGLMFSFSPTSGITWLITGFAVVVLGGAGSIKGTLLGGLILGLIQSLGATFTGDGWRTFIGYVVFLIVLSVRPQGLFGRKGSY
ncbi:MAG: branched-chain amino acid ABC transporter permease [Thermoleophilia bacterium]|nr:branched-chain amino acid ABC transporter permease [Thermoleophilia bacterium]